MQRDDNSELDSRIRILLGAELSSDFERRVCQRVASESMRSRTAMAIASTIVPVSSLAATAMVFMLWGPVLRMSKQAPAASKSSKASASLMTALPVSLPEAPANVESQPRQRSVRQPSRLEAWISPSEGEGVQLLLAAIRAGRLNSAVFDEVPASFGVDPPLQFSESAVTPIVIDPLPQAVLEGMNP